MSKLKLKVGEGVAQGDIWIKRIAKKDVPKNLGPVGKIGDQLILAYGEATGHHHGIVDEEGIKVLEDIERKYIVVADRHEAHLTHQEHGTLDFEPGAYEVRGQLEYVEKDKPRPVYD